MILLKPSDTSHNVTVYVRKETTDCVLSITDEESNIVTEESISGTYDSGKFTFTFTFTFIENRFYYMKLLDIGTNLILNKSKIFATVQDTVNKYSMNNNFYTIIEKDEREYNVKQ